MCIRDRLKEACNSSYAELSPYGLSLELPEDSETFFDNLIGYLNTIDKLNKQDSIKTNQYNAYIEKLTKCTNSFSDLLEDLEPAIKLIRKDNRSLDVIPVSYTHLASVRLFNTSA